MIGSPFNFLIYSSLCTLFIICVVALSIEHWVYSYANFSDDSLSEYYEFVVEEDKQFELNLNMNIALPTRPQFDFMPILKETLEYFAAKGDVQLSVSLIIVLGDIVKVMNKTLYQ